MRVCEETMEVKGFSLIELLVVVAVIVILAALAIPNYSASRVAADDATAKSDLRNAITSIEFYHVRNGTYPATSSDLFSSGFNLSPGVSFTKYDLKTESDGSKSIHMHVPLTFPMPGM